MPALYDRIGAGYTKRRCADERIVDELAALLGLPSGSAIADVGAGTGNYSVALAERGYRIKAVEPSDVMRRQSPRHEAVEWFDGTAEALPLRDASVDGVVCVLAAHHFTSTERALCEMYRVCPKGPVVWLTFDPRVVPAPWFADYFPGIWRQAYDAFLSLDALASLFLDAGFASLSIVPFPIPHDLKDCFMDAPWRRPDMFLDAEVRKSCSGFALADPAEVEHGLTSLAQDLADGVWRNRYYGLLDLKSADWGYRFIKADSLRLTEGR